MFDVSAGCICWTGCEVGFEVGAGFAAAVGPLPAELLKEAGCTGVMGVEGVGVAGGSAASVVAVEFFLFGRYSLLVNVNSVSKIHTFLAVSPSFPFLPLGLGLFACEGVGGAPPEFGEDG